MAAPATRLPDICQHLDGARQDLMESIQGLTDAQMQIPSPEGWSVKDILAHVVMWEETALPDMRRVGRGDEAALDAWDHSLNDQWNHIQVTLRRRFPLEQVMRELAEARQSTVDFLRTVGEDRLDSGFIPNTCAIHARHDRDHGAQIRRWRQEQGL
jgi:hypothetical protein